MPLDHQQRRRGFRRHRHREARKGTKVFSLVGKVNNTGLVEVPMGITLREIIYDIGGGMLPDRRFKAVQTGGPSGGCMPETLLDLPIDFDEPDAAGSMMGSGGMVVMDEATCMVDVATYFLRVHVRGVLRQVRALPRWHRPPASTSSSASARARASWPTSTASSASARLVKASSLCGLGQTAPNPVLSTLRYFRDEYEEHITARRCPAVVCRDLVVYRIIPDKCTGCQRCVQACPTGAITGPRAEVHNLDPDKCIKCRSCYEVCHFGAIAGEAAAGEVPAGDAIVIESGGRREH